MASTEFFNSVRASLFRGRLSQGQVDGMNRIVASGLERGWARTHLAYALATAFHETAEWMQPIREGARRFGPDYTDASARRAVASIHAKGIIRTNYALPAGPWKQSYYGRGLVQITWYDNYLRLGRRLQIGDDLARKPDMALEWPVALDLLFIGMEEGLYTGKALKDYSLPAQYSNARAIINGDVRKNGGLVASQAAAFEAALETDFAAPSAPVQSCPAPEPRKWFWQ